ncbi:MAG: response regulator transcription factor [Bacteroidetes bacterium]|nr:response regulator transcription factor [Bacteroidota bacterium]MBU1116814.1 response regulator transcription factor [Bacteroidota bacterium]MBU1799423.1 response regulator transcription factor [Bacteroidota bacterium]
MKREKKIQNSPINVWLIEDNLAYSNTISKLINNTSGMKCLKVFSMCEDSIKNFSPEELPDVVLLDIGLPGINGIQCIGKLKQISTDIQIVILTVYDDNDKLFDALCSGASGYLLKDSSPEKIISSIKEVKMGGAPMNMLIANKVLKMFSSFKQTKSDYGLTDREREILQYIVDGLTKQQIADKIFLSFHTVNTHIKNIYNKLHVHSRSGVVTKVFKENII